MAKLNEIVKDENLLSTLVSKVTTEGCKFLTETELPQGSQEWLTWRAPAQSVSATDMAVILSGSHYGKTPYQLWAEKVGLQQPAPFPKAVQDAMAKGNHDEPIIRNYISEKMGIGFKPVCCESNKIPNLKCSLDGYNQKEGIILEIKSLSRKRYDSIKSGDLTSLSGYYNQIYWQLAISGAEKAYLVCAFVDEENKVFEPEILQVTLDQGQREEILKKGIIFLNQILSKIAPAEGQKVVVEAEQKALNQEEVDELKANYDAIKQLEEDLKLLKQQQEDLLASHKKKMEEQGIDKLSLPFGLELSRTERKGSVDYKKVLKEKEIILTPEEEDSFRKASTTSWSLKQK